MSMSLSGITHGASLGIFSMGLFLPWVNSKVSSKLRISLRNFWSEIINLAPSIFSPHFIYEWPDSPQIITVYQQASSLKPLKEFQLYFIFFQKSEFDSRCYQIFWEVVGLERCALSLMSTFEELLGTKSSGSGLEIREYGRKDPSRWQRSTLFPQKLALNSSTRGGRSVGIVRSRTQATEFRSYSLV
jgi:hypothetical protein